MDAALPHITIELPVFKESLKETMYVSKRIRFYATSHSLFLHHSAPSVSSLKKAMQTYARQGGTSSIFIHDDGLQIISEEQRQERIAFYTTHNIGWVARPKHDGSPGGFKRAGRFKKASNMNYGLALSVKLERYLKDLVEGVERGEMEEEEHDKCLEDKALAMAVEETFEETGGKWRPWASNGKSIRIGEIILIVDADTIVPEVCAVRIVCLSLSLSYIGNRTACAMLPGNSQSVQMLPSSSTNQVGFPSFRSLVCNQDADIALHRRYAGRIPLL